MTEEQRHALEAALLQTKRLAPFRIVWGYIDADGLPVVYASKDKRAMNREVRAGREVLQAV